MTGLTVTSSSATGILLGDTAANPVSIAAGVYVSSTPAYAIGSTTPYDWTIINSGTLQALGSNSLSDGILLTAGAEPTTTPLGQITNNRTGLIEGYQVGVSIGGAGTVVNLGTITNNATAGAGYSYNNATFTPLYGGVLLAAGGVSNAASAVISSYFEGVGVGDGGSVLNAGTISGSGSNNGFGVVLPDGGAVLNASGGTITAGLDAILTFVNPASVVNQGLIAGNYVAVGLGGGGVVSNASGGTISSAHFGIEFAGSTGGSVTNSAGGSISGGAYAVDATGIVALINAGILTGTTSAGVYLQTGGSVANAGGGTIGGGKYGLFSRGDTTLTNAGSVSGTADVGVVILASASINNTISGQITGERDGIYISGSTYSAVTNDGVIIGSQAAGVWLGSGGTVANDRTGAIFGGPYGVRFTNDTGTVVNAGTIASQQTLAGAAVQLADGGSVTNSAGGSIRAQWIGVQIGTTKSVAVAGTIINEGTISATDSTNGAAVWVTGPAAIDNRASGTITGGLFGIVAYDQVTIVNQGSIGGSEYGFAAIGGGFADRVVAVPGASFSGLFSGGNTLGSAIYSTLELANGSSSGVITNVGSFIDFGQIALDAGASWTLGGTIAADETVAFGGAQASLTLLEPTAAYGTISGFAATDTLVLSGIASTDGLSFNGATLIVHESNGQNLNLPFAVPENLIFSVADGSTDIVVACFGEGTHIQTEAGAVVVEALRPGMQVLSFFGGNREIIWIGHRHIDCTKHPRPRTVWPIEIEAGAFGPELPAAPLRVSPEHAIYVNQVLIPARFLTNGTTIRQISVARVTYYHVELPRHDVLYAEGLPAESYLNTGNRSNFSGSMPVSLFPDFSALAANLWEAEGCAPLVIHGAELEDARRALKARAVRRVATALNSPVSRRRLVGPPLGRAR